MLESFQKLLSDEDGPALIYISFRIGGWRGLILCSGAEAFVQKKVKTERSGGSSHVGLRRKSRGNSRQTRKGKGLSATRDGLQNHQAYCLQIKDSPRNLLKEQGGGNGIT